MRLTRYTQLVLLAAFFFFGRASSQLSQYPLVTFSDALFDDLAKNYGQTAKQRVKNWQALIDEYQSMPIDEQLSSVNRFFNRVEFKDDKKVWGHNDYWATPFEFLGINAGDCEDFTIAKYVSLRALGVDDEKLRLMYVTTRQPRQAHMVLAYYPSKDAIPLVLDNINKRILPASQRRDLIPIYSFNGAGLWLAKEQGRGRQIQTSNNNKLWADLNKRMSKGLQSE